MKKIHILSASLLLAIAAASIIFSKSYSPENSKINPRATTSASRHHATQASHSTTHRNSSQQRTITVAPDSAAFLNQLKHCTSPNFELTTAFDQVELFRSGTAADLTALTAALPQAPSPMAKGFIAQAMLRIPSDESLQAVLDAAVQEPDPAAKQAILDAFHSLEEESSLDLLTSAIAITTDPHILSHITQMLRHTPTSRTQEILATLSQDSTLPGASQEILTSLIQENHGE